MAAVIPFTPRQRAAQAVAAVPVVVNLPAADHEALTRYCALGGLSVADALCDLAANLAAHVRSPERR